MSKQKSIFVSALLSVSFAALIAAMYVIARPVFFLFLGIFAAIGFLAYTVAFCKWLEKPSEKKAESVEPPEVVQGDDVYDYSDIIEKVKVDEEAEK